MNRDAEYELLEGKQLIARIIRGPDGWRACLTNGEAFGLPFSPVGMNGFREVRDWMKEHWGKKKF